MNISFLTSMSVQDKTINNAFTPQINWSVDVNNQNNNQYKRKYVGG